MPVSLTHIRSILMPGLMQAGSQSAFQSIGPATGETIGKAFSPEIVSRETKEANDYYRAITEDDEIQPR